MKRTGADVGEGLWVNKFIAHPEVASKISRLSCPESWLITLFWPRLTSTGRVVSMRECADMLLMTHDYAPSIRPTYHHDVDQDWEDMGVSPFHVPTSNKSYDSLYSPKHQPNEQKAFPTKSGLEGILLSARLASQQLSYWDHQRPLPIMRTKSAIAGVQEGPILTRGDSCKWFLHAPTKLKALETEKAKASSCSKLCRKLVMRAVKLSQCHKLSQCS